ncbi:hypothetical protein [Paenibacillus albus]|uniref:Uncharacterized protein n=1 Tax=Paenibacillus albus TaxID=2495582 RepID=A0A3Q8XAM9_9BACL|nr:hypothetical protein [Paenibacillus albus]AZN42677.1 hypothetical protein EJC50_25535 [Paenibacillus albus]
MDAAKQTVNGAYKLPTTDPGFTQIKQTENGTVSIMISKLNLPGYEEQMRKQGIELVSGLVEYSDSGNGCSKLCEFHET